MLIVPFLISNIYSYEISQLKIELNDIYNSFTYITKEIKQDQIEFIKNIDNCNDNNNCIISSYKARIKELKASLENSKTFPINIIEHMRNMQKSSALCETGNCESLYKSSLDEPLDCKELPELNNLWNDFFRYKDIKIKPKIIEYEKYNSPKVKDTLKYCWDLELDRDVYKKNKFYNTNKPDYYFYEMDKDGQDYSISKIKGKKYIRKRKSIDILNTTLNNLDYLVLTGGAGSILFIEKDFCNYPLNNKDLLKLLEQSKQIKISNKQYSMSNQMYIMNYKGNDYFLKYEKEDSYYNDTGTFGNYFYIEIYNIKDMIFSDYTYERRDSNTQLKYFRCDIKDKYQ